MFSLAIENVREKNYFSEKIVDCFITKTIPIYWGCPNISDFFDINGIIEFKDFNDFLNISNNLKDLFYNERKYIINENFKKSLYYGAIFNGRMNEIIKERGIK
jgi:hypothetical protein